MKKRYSLNENLAYNLELFEKNEKTVVEKPKKKIIAKPKQNLLSIKTVAIFLVLVVTISFILTGYAKVSELTAESTTLQKQLSKLESEETSLNLELEKKTSLKTIDDIAKNQLKMSPVQSYQIEYVGVDKSDKTQILKTSLLSSAIAMVSEGISSVKEYLK